MDKKKKIWWKDEKKKILWKDEKIEEENCMQGWKEEENWMNRR